MRRVSVGRKVFIVCNSIFLVLMALLCGLPLVNLLAISLSEKAAVNSGVVTFWPVDFTLMAYEKTFQNAMLSAEFGVGTEEQFLGLYHSGGIQLLQPDIDHELF